MGRGEISGVGGAGCGGRGGGLLSELRLPVTASITGPVITAAVSVRLLFPWELAVSGVVVTTAFHALGLDLAIALVGFE